MRHVSTNKGSKRKGGAARLRDKKNKLLLETASSCYSISNMFAKKTNIQSPTVELVEVSKKMSFKYLILFCKMIMVRKYIGLLLKFFSLKIIVLMIFFK